MKDNVLFISVGAAYASLRPHILNKESCAEPVLENQPTCGLCYLSLSLKKEKNSGKDLVEVWKTLRGYLHALATLAYLKFGVAFPTTSKKRGIFSILP
jgi:hypothetical protein